MAAICSREATTQQLLRGRAVACDNGQRQGLLDEVVALNLELARRIARGYRGRGVEDDDLEQVACLGLMKAVRSYRVEDGVPFTAYAVPTIRGEVKRFFRDCSWTVRIPRRLQELQGKLAVVRPVLAQELGREPTADELAERLGVKTGELREAEAARGCFTVVSLDRPVRSGNREFLLVDTVADEEDPSLRRIETLDQLGPLISELDPRDQRVLGLAFVENWRQADIGRDLGLSQIQVSRLLAKILARLRERLQPADAAA